MLALLRDPLPPVGRILSLWRELSSYSPVEPAARVSSVVSPEKRPAKAERFTVAKCNSYGLVLGAGAGVVRETAGVVLGHYFRKRREFVEMVVQAGVGVGIVLFSVVYREAVG